MNFVENFEEWYNTSEWREGDHPVVVASDAWDHQERRIKELRVDLETLEWDRDVVASGYKRSLDRKDKRIKELEAGVDRLTTDLEESEAKI